MSRVLYHLRTALNRMARSPVVAGVTVGTVAVVFVVLGIFALLGHNLSLVADRLAAGLGLDVYLEDACTPGQRAQVERTLRADEAVVSVRYIDRQQALALFRKRSGPAVSVLDGLEENPFPASYQVRLRTGRSTPREMQRLAQQVVNLGGVEEVQYGQAWVRRFFDFMESARLLGLVIGALIVLAALLIVSNTIRLSVFARRDEMVILKLVGATDGFIKAPFYLEGLLFGLLGAGLGTGCTWLVFSLLVPGKLLAGWLGGAGLEAEFLPHTGVTWMILGGAVLGVLGTLTSLWRHLKV